MKQCHETSNKINAIKFLEQKLEDDYFASFLEFELIEHGKYGPKVVVDVAIDGEYMEQIRIAMIDAIKKSLKFRVHLLSNEKKDIQNILSSKEDK
jgi:hypothetical protein